MGSRPAPAPVTYMPEPQAPTVFRSIVPEADFARATQYIQDLKTEREAAKAERYAEIGTPEEIRARMDKRSKAIEAAYESSLPQPEIDYTAGLDPARLNNLDTFLSRLVERRQGESSPITSVFAPKVDTAKAAREAVQAPAPQVAPRPTPAPAPALEPEPALSQAPAPKTQEVRIFGESISNAKKQNRKFGMGGDEMRELRNYSDDQIYSAANAVGFPKVNTAADARKVLDYLKNK